MAMTVAASYLMLEVLMVGGLSLLDLALMALFVALFAWIALSSSARWPVSFPCLPAAASGWGSIRKRRCRRFRAAPRC